jgi:hypothetical protein
MDKDGGLMKKKFILVIAVVVILLVAIGVGLFVFNGQAPPEVKARDATINYIKDNHPETSFMMHTFAWEGGIRYNFESGKDSYIYSSPDQGWSLTIQRPAGDTDATYTILAVCTSGGAVLEWHGTYHNGTINETSYRLTQ